MIQAMNTDDRKTCFEHKVFRGFGLNFFVQRNTNALPGIASGTMI